MKFINNISNTIFEDEEAARQHMLDNMTLESYVSYLEPQFSYKDLLKWALEHNFFEEHEDLINEAEEEYFNDWYKKYDDEDEEEVF